MDEPDPELAPPTRALGDLPAERICLRCKTAFESEGFGERICRRCKSSLAWKTAAPTGQSSGRQR